MLKTEKVVLDKALNYLKTRNAEIDEPYALALFGLANFGRTIGWHRKRMTSFPRKSLEACRSRRAAARLVAWIVCLFFLSLTAPGRAQMLITEFMAANVKTQMDEDRQYPDWIELYNKSAVAPVALQGIYLATSNVVHQITSLSFIAPLGYVQLFADEGVGADHLDFKLSASGETLTLSDATGGTIQTISFGAQAEGVSQGRLPNGTGSVTNFVGSASPEAANYLSTWTGPVINEVLARNRSLTVGTQIVDFVEIFNPSGSSFNLSGMSLSVNSSQVGEFIFPTGTSIAASGYLLIKCDGASPASTNAGAFNTGESLDGDSGGVYLFNTNGQVVNFVEYGPQVDDLPIGLSGGQWRLLSSATPGAVNSAAIVLGNATALRLNE